ncbi:DNA repair protein rhp57 [Rhodotorula kratochvilovae]
MQNVELRHLPLSPKYRAHLLKAQYLTAAEVLLTPPAALSRRTKLPPADCAALLLELSAAVCALDPAHDRTVAEIADAGETGVLTTGDAGIDELLGGGVRVGTLAEIAGHSSSGKTHLCLQLALTAQLPPSRGGLGGGALFISSEGTVPTSRLFELASHLAGDDDAERTPWDFLDNVHAEKAPDVETLQAVLAYHAPAAIERVASASAPLPLSLPAAPADPSAPPLPSQALLASRPPARPPLPIRLLLLDSLAAPFRAASSTSTSGFAQRARELAALGDALKRLAAAYQLAVVVVNQVSDTFSSSSSGGERPLPPSFLAPAPPGIPPPPHAQYALPPLLYSRFQSPHITGEAASLPSSLLPLPFLPQGAGVQAALGHAWAAVPSTRLLCLVRRDGGGRARRAVAVVWSAFASRAVVEIELRPEGVCAVGGVRRRWVVYRARGEGEEQDGQEDGQEDEREGGSSGLWAAQAPEEGEAGPAWETEAERAEREARGEMEGAGAK